MDIYTWPAFYMQLVHERAHGSCRPAECGPQATPGTGSIRFNTKEYVRFCIQHSVYRCQTCGCTLCLKNEYEDVAPKEMQDKGEKEVLIVQTECPAWNQQIKSKVLKGI